MSQQAAVAGAERLAREFLTRVWGRTHEVGAIDELMTEDYVITSAGKVIRLPYSLERVVAYLAIAHGPVGRSRLAGALWPDVPERRASGALRSALWRLHRVCGVIERDERVLALDPNVAVDLSDLADLTLAPSSAALRIPPAT